MDNSKVFDTLFKVNVNEYTEKKNTGNATLTYLSWANAWAEVKKRFEDATYEIIKFNGLPYVFDEKTGYMVYTTVTINGITHEMWLPVMDANNKAMLDRPYEVKTKYKSFTVQPATMFEINKTVMRCLTKNLAMFGLGLYIYAGEDLPETPEEEKKPATQPKTKKPVAKAETPVNNDMPTEVVDDTPVDDTPKKETKMALVKLCKESQIDILAICREFKLDDTATESTFLRAIEECKRRAEAKRAEQ